MILLVLGGAQGVPVTTVAVDHLADRPQILRNSLPDRALVGLILGGADLHRPIERKVAVINLLQNIDRSLDAVIAFKHPAAENLACDFNLLRKVNFLLAGEQGDFAHLRQIHANRIVDALVACFRKFLLQVNFDVFVVFFRFISLIGNWWKRKWDRHFVGQHNRSARNHRFDLFHLLRRPAGLFLELRDVGLVDELDAHLVHHL